MNWIGNQEFTLSILMPYSIYYSNWYEILNPFFLLLGNAFSNPNDISNFLLLQSQKGVVNTVVKLLVERLFV